MLAIDDEALTNKLLKFRQEQAEKVLSSVI
jgi:phosphoribosylcarboxyaminoimidazole (NCAIR) mutase